MTPRQWLLLILFVPGEAHATDILLGRPDLAERLAIWLQRELG